MAAILFNNAEPFEQIENTPCEIRRKLVKRFQRRRLRLQAFIHVYQGARADNPRGQNLIVSKTFCYFNHTLYVSAISK